MASQAQLAHIRLKCEVVLVVLSLAERLHEITVNQVESNRNQIEINLKYRDVRINLNQL